MAQKFQKSTFWRTICHQKFQKFQKSNFGLKICRQKFKKSPKMAQKLQKSTFWAQSLVPKIQKVTKNDAKIPKIYFFLAKICAQKVDFWSFCAIFGDFLNF